MVRYHFLWALLAGALMVAFPVPARAQCSDSVESQRTALAASFAALAADHKRIAAIAAVQAVRIAALPRDLASGLPVLPPAPALPEGFDASGIPDWTCGIAGDAGGAQLTLIIALEEASVALAEWETALEARARALDTAETMAETMADDRPQAPPTEPAGTPDMAATTDPPAAACGAESQALARAQRDRFRDMSRHLRQLVARSDTHGFRMLDLTPDAVAAVGPAPDAPALPHDAFDADGYPLWSCDGTGAAGPGAADLDRRLTEAATALDLYEAALAEREVRLAAAEAGAGDTLLPIDLTGPDGDGGIDGGIDGGVAGVDPGPTAPPAVAGRSPIPDADNSNIFRRVITLPDARLAATAGGAVDGDPLPVFTVLYVYDTATAGGADWLEVGTRALGPPDGWIAADQGLAWSTMLVMQFASRGQRERVLFFDEATVLADIVNSPFYASDAEGFYEEIAAERARMADDPGHVPVWSDSLVAIEPETAVTFQNSPYLLPILDWRQELFDGAVETTLLQVAAIPATAEAGDVGSRDTDSFTVSAAESAIRDDEFRVGIVFVMDTTLSMRPFIERTRETVESFFDAFSRFESASFVSFGLVGFRDNINRDPEGLSYVTRIFQPLDPGAPAAQVLANLGQVAEAQVPTFGFEEDTYAGIIDAIEEMDWSPYDARLVILVTDASARTGNDPLARDPGVTAQVLAEAARASGIAIVPIHLLTPANQRQGDVARAEAQYRTLAQTGDVNLDKYLAVDATSDAIFAAQIGRMAEAVAANVFQANAGQVVGSEILEPEAAIRPDDPDRLARIVTNEIFRAQLESLAAVDGGDVPAFLAGWAADRDLTDPDITALEVSVFLTRNQLSNLDRQLDSLVGAFRSGGEDPNAFFDQLQLLAAEMSTDPDAVRADERVAIRELLPAFLANLPYRSEVLNLDRDFWSSLSVAQRQEFIEAIEAKQRVYQNIFDQTDLWQDFGSGDPALEMTPIRLTNLP